MFPWHLDLKIKWRIYSFFFLYPIPVSWNTVYLVSNSFRRIAKEGGVKDTSDLWIDFAACARHGTDKNGLTVHAKGRVGSLVRYWSTLSVTVVKGPPSKKKDLKESVDQEYYAKYLPPLPIMESKTYR